MLTSGTASLCSSAGSGKSESDLDLLYTERTGIIIDIMVCPVIEQANQRKLDSPTEYPYQPLYRPWSWTLSTLSNIFLFAVVFLIGYAIYRRRLKQWRSGRYSAVSYRKVDMREEVEGRRNVLVIGAEGYFGKCLVESLLRDGGYNVHCLDSYIPYKEHRNSEVCSYSQADICSYDDMLLCLRGMQAVFHTSSVSSQYAFIKKADFHHAVVTGTENVVRVCRECNVQQLIYTSSATVVVGKNWNQQLADESAPYPKSHYSEWSTSLAAAEQVVLNSNGKDGFVTCAMRLAPITCSVNDPFVESLLTESMFLVKNSNHGVSIVSANAAAKAHILAEKKLCSDTPFIAAGKAYNLCSETRVLYHDLVGKLASDDETIWGQAPPTEVSRWVLKLLAYINYYSYKMMGALLVSKNISPPMLCTQTTELSFSSRRANLELGWEDGLKWQEEVTSLVQKYKARQDTKKEQ